MKMRTSMLLLFFLMVVTQEKSFTASIPAYVTEENIEDNLVNPERNSVEGLVPPKPQAQDHYNPLSKKPVQKTATSYVVEITRKFLKLQTTGFPPQIVKLKENETEGIQKLSLAFVELLNDSKLSSQEETETESPDWKELNPVITLQTTGINIQFLDAPEKDQTVQETSESERTIIWNFLSKYAQNIFNAKLKELNVTLNTEDAFLEQLEHPKPDPSDFQNFLNSIWKIMRLSIDYAETNFEGWTTPKLSETTAEEYEVKTQRHTAATLFAYEEPSPEHVFPSQEFEKRSRDIDSLFYGRGIV